MIRTTDPAIVLERVASLVTAGIAPRRAWRVVADDVVGTGSGSGPGSVEASRAPGRRAPGGPDALQALAHRGGVWADVAAVVAVAERTGAPVVPALMSLARAVRESAESDRAIRVALAGPRASARVVLALPVLGLVLGSMWGAGAVETLLTTPVGWAACAAAGVLVAVAARWSAVLVRAAQPPERVAGALLEAWAVAVSGGGSWRSAGRAVRDAWPDQRSRGAELEHVRRALASALDHGVPVAALLRAAAEDVRRDAAATGLADAQRLGVRLVLPLGVCILPAFVLVGVLPVVVGVLSSTVGTSP